MRQQGLTLIEVIIYSALLALIISSGLILMHSLISSADKTMDQLDALVETQFIFAHLELLLNENQIIIEPASNQTGDRLIVRGLNNIDIQVNIDDKKIKITDEDGESMLSSQIINSLLFERTNYNNHELIKVWVSIGNQTFSNTYFLQ